MHDIHEITVSGLTKKFDGFTALDNISFQVESGELFGLLGPNGAGKTTTINILSTLLKQTSGSASVAGYDVSADKSLVRKNIGIVFQDPALDNKLTGMENLEFHGMLYGMNCRDRKKTIAEVLELVELSDKASLLVEKYSGGMKRRLEIARGLIHKPRVLFLDEPTLGLDVQTRRHIWAYINKLIKDHKMTIILTTHYLEEADFLCGRIAIIDRGKILALDTPSNLKNSLGGDVVSLRIDGPLEGLREKLEKVAWIRESAEQDGALVLTLEKAEERLPALIGLVHAEGLGIITVNYHKPSLDDVFLHFTGKTIRDGEQDKKGMMRNSFQARSRR